MQSWIHLGGGIYAADRADEGFLKVEGYTFQGPVLELDGSIFGGSALRFLGTEGMHTAEDGLTEGWLSFADAEFPELKLTAVLQTRKGMARVRFVLTGDVDEEVGVGAGDAVTLSALRLAETPELFAPVDGVLLPLSAADGLVPYGALAVKTAQGALILGGGDFFAASHDEDDFSLASVVRFDDDHSLKNGGAVKTDWLTMTAAEDLAAAMAQADWLK